MDLTRGREGQAVDYQGMNGAITQKIEQSGHVSLELLRVHQSAGGDAVKHRATAAEQAAQRAPKLDPGQAESAEASLRTLSPWSATHSQRAALRTRDTQMAVEMCAANRIKGGIDASTTLAACGERHGRNEVAGAIVDRGCAEALDHSQVRSR